MKKTNIRYLHIIPFDLGYIFYDLLSVENDKNLQMTEDFLNKLSSHYRRNSDVEVKNTFETKNHEQKTYGYRCFDDVVNQSICRVRLQDNLYAFLMVDGIGCFVLFDDGVECSKKLSMRPKSKVFAFDQIKRKSWSAILLGKIDEKDTDIFLTERQLMRDFMHTCWDLLDEVLKRYHLERVRMYSSNREYKNDGLSYVLTAYILEKDVLSNDELKYLLYAAFSDKVPITKDCATKLIKEFDVDCVYASKSDQASYMFAWDAVSAVVDKVPATMEELLSHKGLCKLLRQEIYVQTRWYIADNSLDNTLKSFQSGLLDLQKIEGMLEQYEAELRNEISANMTTEEKEILKNIVHTSGILSLYASAKCQIRIQRRIKEEHENRQRKRSAFIMSLFMAIFTASTLYSEVSDIIFDEKSDLLLFVVLLFVAIGTVLLDYRSK